MAEWLRHPNEFGVEPVRVKRRRRYGLNLMHYGRTWVHLMEYEMPCGTRGRGFVNPITWSFQGENVEQVPDDALVHAYCGWLFLFPSLQNGGAVTQFESNGEEARYLAQLQNHGLTEIVFGERYRIGDSELYGFTARYQGQRVQGAGNTAYEVGLPESDPRFHLPAIYFLLGETMMQK